MISEYTKSLKTYGYSLLLAHIIAFTWLFPYIVFCMVLAIVTFMVAFAYCRIVHEIEEANRNYLLHLIDTCTVETTRDNLRFQLYMHDKHSTFSGDTF